MSKIAPIHNKCEICGGQASAGIDEKNGKGVIRYACQEHYFDLNERIDDETKQSSSSSSSSSS